MTATRSNIAVFISGWAVVAAPLFAADDAKPAPATVRAKAVVIKKAAPAAAVAAPAIEVKAVIIEAAPAPAQPADKAAVAKDAAENVKQQATEKPAGKIAPANLKGFGKNDEARKPVRAAPAAALAAPMLQAVPADQMKQMAEQFKQQLRPVLAGELAFIRLMCDLPMEKRTAVRAAGLTELDAIATTMAEQQNRGRVLGAVRVAVPAKQQAVNDPPKAIRAALDAALKDALPEDQYKVFHEEALHRKEQRKQAAIHSVVARLDSLLCLTTEARDKMTESLADNWQEDWERWLQMHQYGDQYFPVVPDQHITAHLNAEQRQVWTGLQKVNFGGWGNFGGGVVVADDGWWGEPIKNDAGADGVLFIEGAIGF